MEWFKTWFDTEYYHILYKNRNWEEAKSFTDRLLNYLSPSQNAYILDLACGKGRHSKNISDHGYKTLGVDLSKNSIDYAIKTYGQTDLLDFRTHDMREFIPSTSFDYILNLFTSFGYFNDFNENLKMLQSVRQMLKPSGVFVLDYLNAHRTIQNLVPAETKEEGNLKFSITREFTEGKIVKNIEVIDTGEAHHYREQVQAVFLEDFKELFEGANLKIIETFGDYELNPFHIENSSRLILVATVV